MRGVEQTLSGIARRSTVTTPNAEDANVEQAEVPHVLRRRALDDVLADGVEILGDQRVERPALPGAVAVEDDDLVAPAAFAPRTAALISCVWSLRPSS
jgi:hypothetical protein